MLLLVASTWKRLRMMATGQIIYGSAYRCRFCLSCGYGISHCVDGPDICRTLITNQGSMDKNFEVFDFHRIFVGDAPLTFLLEIVFRTIIMYSYTVVLLRILGKRGMGQLSSLELAIIISFGSAVGDPMVGANTPIVHGMVAITVITFLQIWIERLINRNKKVEALMEGTPNLVVDNGIVKLDCLVKDNLSKEDLFRALRVKDVEHL